MSSSGLGRIKKAVMSGRRFTSKPKKEVVISLDLINELRRYGDKLKDKGGVINVCQALGVMQTLETIMKHRIKKWRR